METMIYIALFGIIMTGAITGAYNLLEGGNRNIDSTQVEEEGTFINRKINWALAGAESATVSGGGSTITIVRPDLGAQSPLVISGGGGVITISRGAGAPTQLNNDRFQVGNIAFVYTASVNGRPPSVRASFEVAGKPFAFRNYLRQ